jgi:hypothetical protein
LKLFVKKNCNLMFIMLAFIFHHFCWYKGEHSNTTAVVSNCIFIVFFSVASLFGCFVRNFHPDFCKDCWHRLFCVSAYVEERNKEEHPTTPTLPCTRRQANLLYVGLSRLEIRRSILTDRFWQAPRCVFACWGYRWTRSGRLIFFSKWLGEDEDAKWDSWWGLWCGSLEFPHCRFIGSKFNYLTLFGYRTVLSTCLYLWCLYQHHVLICLDIMKIFLLYRSIWFSADGLYYCRKWNNRKEVASFHFVIVLSDCVTLSS